MALGLSVSEILLVLLVAKLFNQYNVPSIKEVTMSLVYFEYGAL